MNSPLRWSDLRHASPWQWLLAFTLFVLVGAVSYLLQLHPYLQMRASLAEAQSVVTQIEPTNHMTVRYRFTAAGLLWRGGESSDLADTLHPGDPLTVYYDAIHPSYQSLRHPDTYVSGGVFFVLFTGSLAGFFGLALSACLLRELRTPNHALQRTASGRYAPGGSR